MWHLHGAYHCPLGFLLPGSVPGPLHWSGPSSKSLLLCIDTVYTSSPSQFPAPVMFVCFSVLVDEILFQRQFGKWGSISHVAGRPHMHSCLWFFPLGGVNSESRAFPFPVMLVSVPISLMVILGRRHDFFYFGWGMLFEGQCSLVLMGKVLKIRVMLGGGACGKCDEVSKFLLRPLGQVRILLIPGYGLPLAHQCTLPSILLFLVCAKCRLCCLRRLRLFQGLQGAWSNPCCRPWNREPS